MRSFRRVAAIGGLVLLGVLLGAASAWWQIRPAAGLGLGSGPWQVSLLAGSADADAVTRAEKHPPTSLPLPTTSLEAPC